MKKIFTFLLAFGLTVFMTSGLIAQNGAVVSGQIFQAPRTTTGSYASPTRGFIIIDTSTIPHRFYGYNGIGWVLLDATGGGGSGSGIHAVYSGYGLSNVNDSTLKLDSATLSLTYVRHKDSSVAGGYYPYSTNPKSYLVAADIAGKLNISDTAAMLASYLRINIAAATYATIANLALKLNISDTAGMLAHYLQSTVAAATYYPLSGGNLNTGSFIGFPKLNTQPATPASGYVNTYFDSLSRLSYVNSAGYRRTYSMRYPSDQLWYFPYKVNGGALADSADVLFKANNLSDVANANTSLNNLLPSQTSNSGKYLTTNGTNSSWASVSGGTSFTRQVITSGSSGTVTGGNYIVTFDPASTLSSYILTLPASPSDMDIVKVEFGGTLTSGTIVTALMILPNSGQTILDNTPPGSAVADNYLEYQYRTSNTKWYRRKP